MDSVNEKVNEYLEKKSNLELILRLIQWIVAVVSFLCSTSVTGLSAGDFTFLITYTLWVYTLIYVIFVLRQRKIDIIPLHKLVIDGVFLVMLLSAAISLCASSAFQLCAWNGCASTYACVVFLFVGTIIQGAALWITYSQDYRKDDDDDDVISPPAPMLEA